MLYLPSDPLYLTLHPLYLCHQKLGINYNTTTLCMISNRLYVWHRIHYLCYQNNGLWHHTPLCMTSYPSVYYITPSIFMTSFPIHMLSPYCFHDNTATIPGISPIGENWQWPVEGQKKMFSHLGEVQKNHLDTRQLEILHHWEKSWVTQKAQFLKPRDTGYKTEAEPGKENPLCSSPRLRARWVTPLVSESLQPRDCSPPGSSFNGILQPRIL